jgi:hypothetical protein
LGPSGWTTNTIFQYKGGFPWNGPQSRVTLNVGEVLATNAGQEIVLSYESRVVVVYRGPFGIWTNQTIADFGPFVGTSWGAEVGDCDRGHAGEEVFSIYEGVLDFSSGSVYSQSNSTWNQNIVYAAEVGMDAAIADTNPDSVGDEIIVVTEMGPAYEITPPAVGGPGPWSRRTIWDDFENAGWVVKIADVDPATPGNEIVYGTRYSDRIMMSRHNGTNIHNVQVVLTGINTNTLNSMFDVATGQVFVTSPAAEVLGVDGSGSVYVVQKATNQWQGWVLWQDTNALYAVVTADLVPGIPGDEVVVAGAAGVVTLLCNPAPVLNLAATVEPAVLSWTALRGLSYAVETTTNLFSNSPWLQLTNLVYQGTFPGPLSYTNTAGSSPNGRFFRVSASRQP